MNYCLNDNFGYKGLIALIAPNKTKTERREKDYINPAWSCCTARV